jgi:hypothetical protein
VLARRHDVDAEEPPEGVMSSGSTIVGSEKDYIQSMMQGGLSQNIS